MLWKGMAMRCFMTNQDCIFEKPIQEYWDQKTTKSLFVVSPFGYPYDDMFFNIIEPACKGAGILAQRADRAFQLGFVMCTKICKLMQQSDYVLADVTLDNPNVFYELGLAWGFGKKVVLLRDTDAPFAPGFRELFGSNWKRLLSYKELLAIEREAKPVQASRFSGYLDTMNIDVTKEYDIEAKRSQGAYIPGKRICFFCRDGLTDTKFYLRAIQAASEQIRSGEAWQLEVVPVAAEILCDVLPRELSASKVLIVDVTHYAEQADTSMYFALGLSHAMGRETIPITNRAKSHDMSPFDVRGLWQVYFDKLRDLETELLGILTVINEQYDRERSEYPLRIIWDEVLRRPARLSVFTCARGAPPDRNRIGGRTNVDKWDYRSVAELAFFLANTYKQAQMTIEAPIEKITAGLETDTDKGRVANDIETRLRNVQNSVIIIGSPDVSDYAEVVLARIYHVAPYQPEKCKQHSEARQRRCWECKLGKDCVGKRGYLFYKNTKTTNHPRELSSFFREPLKDATECVLWYGLSYECEHSQRGKGAQGETFGVLTLFRDRPECLAPQGMKRWIILLSGFTGIATYGLARLLTSLEVKTGQGKSLEETLKKMNIDLDRVGMQVLVSVRYQSATNKQDYDRRTPSRIEIVDVRPLFSREDEGQR